MKTETQHLTYRDQEIHITGHAAPQSGTFYFTQTNDVQMSALDPDDKTAQTVPIFKTAQDARAAAESDIECVFDGGPVEGAGSYLYDLMSGQTGRTAQSFTDELRAFLKETEKGTPDDTTRRNNFLADLLKNASDHPVVKRRDTDLADFQGRIENAAE